MMHRGTRAAGGGRAGWRWGGSVGLLSTWGSICLLATTTHAAAAWTTTPTDEARRSFVRCCCRAGHVCAFIATDRPTDRPPTGEVSTEAGHSAAAGTASVAAAGHPTTGSSSATDGAMQRDIFRLRLMVRTGCCSFRMRPKFVVVVLVVNFFNHNFVNCKATLVVEIKNQRYLINVSNFWAMKLKVALCHALAFHITSASPSATITPSALAPSATLAPSALCALYSTAADVVAAIAATVTS